MPHFRQPPAWAREHEFELGRQWRADADWSTSKTATQWQAGRGFCGCGPDCTVHGHGAQPVDDSAAVISRVLMRLKLAGVAEAPDVLKH